MYGKQELVGVALRYTTTAMRKGIPLQFGYPEISFQRGTLHLK